VAPRRAVVDGNHKGAWCDDRVHVAHPGFGTNTIAVVVDVEGSGIIGVGGSGICQWALVAADE
jgi:hypothetical protein